jgi:hypothetical protein
MIIKETLITLCGENAQILQVQTGDTLVTIVFLHA